MNLFFMNSAGLEAWGGSEKWMLQTGTELSKKGHQIFFGGREGSLFLQKCKNQNFSILPLKIRGDLDPFIIGKIVTYLRTNHIQVIVCEYNKDIRLAGIASKINSNILVIARTGLPSIKNNVRYRLLYPRLLDGVIVTTNAIKNKYLDYHWTKKLPITVIHDGISLNPLPKMKPLETKRKYDIPDNMPIIGIFGKLVKKKQHNIFLEIAARILKKFHDTIFLIVGDGPERENIQKYAFDLGIIDHIYMTGFLENPFPLYAICDLVLLTSQEEGIPISIMEAMLMKRTVVTFNVGGISELINSGKNGILVPPNDIYLMTEQVQMLLEDKVKRGKMGEAAREFIVKNCSVKKMIEEVEEYLERKWNQKHGGSHGK